MPGSSVSRPRPRAACASLLALCLLCAGPAAAADRAPPVDEIAAIPELAALRDALLDAAARRDADAVAALAAPDIHLSFGGDHGRATLRSWLEGAPGLAWTGPEYFAELERILRQGSAGYSYGEDQERNYCAPYTFYADYPDTLDPFAAIAFTRPDAPVRAAPDPEAEIIATVDYAIAEVLELAVRADPDAPFGPYWVLVRTPDGAIEGYAVSTDFNDAVGYRACFGRDPLTGEWVWNAFIAGD